MRIPLGPDKDCSYVVGSVDVVGGMVCCDDHYG